MADQWIPAAQSLAFLEASSAGFSNAVRLALCARAHAGLIKSRARLLQAGEIRRENAQIPAAFWWAEGHEALQQDWQSGDFSTWFEQTRHWKAFGVSFALDGLLEMLPVENRAVAARSVSVVGKEDWLNAKGARRFAYELAGINPAKAGEAVIDACMLGYVSARAVLMRRADGGRSAKCTAEEREWDVPDWFWENFTGVESSSQDWERGIFSGKGRAPDGQCWMTLTGVHFLRHSLNVLLPQDASPKSETSDSRNTGGRPRKQWWDDMWCAMWGQVYRAELVPKRQADIERAMLEWVEDSGHSVSESVVRPLARKMFAEIEREGGNLSG